VYFVQQVFYAPYRDKKVVSVLYVF
jgi:hypothetical protein